MTERVTYRSVVTESDTLLPSPTPEQKEWDEKAFEVFKSIEDRNPTKDEIRRRVLSKLGPRPETRAVKELPGTIHVLKKLKGRNSPLKLKCTKETALRIWAMEYAEIIHRPSGWYEMKLTKKGKKFLRDLEDETTMEED